MKHQLLRRAGKSFRNWACPLQPPISPSTSCSAVLFPGPTKSVCTSGFGTYFLPPGVLFHPLVHLGCLLLIFQVSTQSCSFWEALPDLRQRLAFLFQSSWDSLRLPLSALNTCALIAIGLLWWATSNRKAHKDPCFLVFLLWSALPLSVGWAHQFPSNDRNTAEVKKCHV